MKIAMFGGTFNPIHIGHLAMADNVSKVLSYDKVIFVPAFVPPHKLVNSHFESPEHRVAMIKAAIKSNSSLDVETCEIQRGGVSYTIDTVKYLIEKYGSQLTEKPGLIMGQENAAEFHKWKNADEIASLSDIIVVSRQQSSAAGKKDFDNTPVNNYTGGFDQVLDKNYLKEKYNFTFLENIVLPVSSTDIRANIAGKSGWRYLVPEPVFEYILEHKLYGYDD